MKSEHILARPPLVLSQEQRESYFENGYLLLEGFVSREWLDRIWEVSNGFIERSRDTDLFLCECCSMTPQSKLHTSYEEILAHRDALGCKQLLLTHLGEEMAALRGRCSIETADDGMLVPL